MSMIRLHIRMNAAVRRRLQAAAATQDENLSEWIRRAAEGRWRQLRDAAVRAAIDRFGTAEPATVLSSIARPGEDSPAAVLQRLRETPRGALTDLERASLDLHDVWAGDLAPRLREAG